MKTKWQKQNSIRVKFLQKRWREQNKEKIKQLNIRWKKKNSKRNKRLNIKWKKKNSGRNKQLNSKGAAKRRGLNWILLCENPFDNSISVDYHHILGAYVVAIPKDLHRLYYGKYHRENLRPILKQIYLEEKY